MKPFQQILTILMCAFFSMQVYAQKKFARYSLSGKITDAKGMPLAGASAYISDLRKGSIADANGNYQIDEIPTGTFLVEIKYIGYKTILQNIDFDQNKTQDFSMVISVTEENEIVITGSSRATSIKRNPIPIVSINKKMNLWCAKVPYLPTLSLPTK